jgi:hypothetical protein
MDNKDRVAAANALISWFNSQDITSRDAEIIMLKVVAKLIISRIGNTHPDTINDEMDEHNRVLGHELIDRIHSVRRLKR